MNRTKKSVFSLDERREGIRKFRKELDLSLAELGRLAGVSPSMLSLFETGKRDLSASAFARVQEAITSAMAERVGAARRVANLADLRAGAPNKPLTPWTKEMETALAIGQMGAGKVTKIGILRAMRTDAEVERMKLRMQLEQVEANLSRLEEKIREAEEEEAVEKVND